MMMIAPIQSENEYQSFRGSIIDVFHTMCEDPTINMDSSRKNHDHTALIV